MVLYEVTVTPDAHLRDAFERYMREKHIAEVLATGCFVAAQFAAGAEGPFRTTYVAPDQASLDRYLDTHAPRLRDDFARHFPSGVSVTRATWRVIGEWPES